MYAAARSARRPVSSTASPVRASSSWNVNGARCHRSRSPVAREDLRGRGRRGSCERDGGERHENDAGEQERQTPHRRAQRRRRVTDVEGRATRPQQGRCRCRQCGLFDVEPLDEVEDRERGHETERKPKRTRAAPIEVVGGDEECKRHRHRERVGRTHHRERLDVHEHMAAPRNVRRHRRDEVDDRDDGDHERGDHRHIVELSRRSKSQWLSVEAEPPGSRVACAPREVGPVLRDEPDADECDSESGEHAERLQQHGDSVAGQHGQAEVPLVDPQTQDIDAPPSRCRSTFNIRTDRTRKQPEGTACRT